MRSILIAPSYSWPPNSPLADEAAPGVEEAGADWNHCDIMDGHFVDNISFGSAVYGPFASCSLCRSTSSRCPVQHPDHYLPRFIDAGANSITVHVEAESKHHVAKTLEQIRGGGCRAGLTLNPATGPSLPNLQPYLAQLLKLLIMTH